MLTKSTSPLPLRERARERGVKTRERGELFNSKLTNLKTYRLKPITTRMARQAAPYALIERMK